MINPWIILGGVLAMGSVAAGSFWAGAEWCDGQHAQDQRDELMEVIDAGNETHKEHVKEAEIEKERELQDEKWADESTKLVDPDATCFNDEWVRHINSLSSRMRGDTQTD